MFLNIALNHIYHNDDGIYKTSMLRSKRTQLKNNHDVVLTLNTHDSTAAFPAASHTLKSTAIDPSGNPDAK